MTRVAHRGRVCPAPTAPQPRKLPPWHLGSRGTCPAGTETMGSRGSRPAWEIGECAAPCSAASMRQNGHPEPFRGVGLSVWGSVLLSVCLSGNLSVWSPARGLEGHTGGGCPGFNPSVPLLFGRCCGPGSACADGWSVSTAVLGVPRAWGHMGAALRHRLSLQSGSASCCRCSGSRLSPHTLSPTWTVC